MFDNQKIALIAFSVLFLSPFAGIFAESKYRYVAVKPALMVRDTPSLSGRIIEKIPFGKKVLLVRDNGPSVTALGLSSNWYQINLNSKIGWAFGAFLSKDNEDFYFNIIEGIAYKQDSNSCLNLPAEHFPKYFNGGCVNIKCHEACGNHRMEADNRHNPTY